MKTWTGLLKLKNSKVNNNSFILILCVTSGINIFLDGYIPTENLRFRETSLVFKVAETANEEEVKRLRHYQVSSPHLFFYIFLFFSSGNLFSYTSSSSEVRKVTKTLPVVLLIFFCFCFGLKCLRFL